MKIALVRRGYSATGGAEAYLSRLAGGLVEAGHEVVLVTSESWPRQAWPHGEMMRLPGATPSAFARAFAGLPGGFDVSLALDRVPGCDVFRAGDGVHAAWLRRRASFEPRWRSWLRRWNPKHGALLMLERQVFQSSAMVIANSSMVAREIVGIFGVPESRLRVVPNGFSGSLPRLPKEQARARLGISASAFCALFLGSGWERKGLDCAVRAIERVQGEALLVVAGRGDARRHRSLRTVFLGPTKDLAGVFSAADVFILPTIYDPFSNACLEALASGLPVLTTSANGFSEVLVPGVHGEVLEAGDADGFAEALEKWRGRDAAEACRARAREYSLERNVRGTLDALVEAGAISARQGGKGL